ncbi:uncharacterized protein LOC133325828 [Musca vetustissima]|uniref:uncharacterized protein LOC133325828 n=1 Tax=Musca vetustissima TaxID=27455 RepID=UPI002AB7D68C|nr:uncharacterized protein LOC133325828 [Musca vetustissima]
MSVPDAHDNHNTDDNDADAERTTMEMLLMLTAAVAVVIVVVSANEGNSVAVDDSSDVVVLILILMLILSSMMMMKTTTTILPVVFICKKHGFPFQINQIDDSHHHHRHHGHGDDDNDCHVNAIQGNVTVSHNSNNNNHDNKTISPSERSGKGCCGQWFAGPPLRALIAVVALGGVACALGGAALGATGLAGPPSSHFTAALLMIGVGVVLVTVSGAAWRMTAPGGPPCLGLGSSVDLGRCGRRPCSRGGGAPQGLLYPEFQHRPPPPSYQASMQEYRLRLLLLDRDRQNGVVRGSSPPPTYRSHAGSLLRAPLTSTIRGAGGIGTTGRAESSIGGSEYSFPPSYRSRNTTPGTISSERSIETEPSGRLLANEDIPEPLSVEQLSEYNTLQQRTVQARLGTSSANNTITTSATTTTINGQSKSQSEEKRNSLQLDQNCIITKRESSSGGDKKDDLVTIVTITPQNEIDTNTNTVECQNSTNLEVTQSGSREQIEILAHL